MVQSIKGLIEWFGSELQLGPGISDRVGFELKLVKVFRGDFGLAYKTLL